MPEEKREYDYFLPLIFYKGDFKNQELWASILEELGFGNDDRETLTLDIRLATLD